MAVECYNQSNYFLFLKSGLLLKLFIQQGIWMTLKFKYYSFNNVKNSLIIIIVI